MTLRDRSSSERRALGVYVRLHRALNSIQALTNGFCARHGLTTSQFATLEALYHKGPMCQRDLARSILRSGGNLTLVVDNLEKRGLVLRCPSKDDRREKVVELTESGRKRIRKIFPDHARNISELFSSLTADEQEELGRLCRVLSRSIGPREGRQPHEEVRPGGA